MFVEHSRRVGLRELNLGEYQQPLQADVLDRAVRHNDAAVRGFHSTDAIGRVVRPSCPVPYMTVAVPQTVRGLLVCALSLSAPTHLRPT